VELLHGITDHPVTMDQDGTTVLDESRFGEVLESSLVLARKVTEWFTIWSNCALKGATVTMSATIQLTNRLIIDKSEHDTADIIGHLVKEKEIPPKLMEEAIPQIEMGPDKSRDQLIAHFLVYIYPTDKGHFGWSRIGWGFSQWWTQCKKFTKHSDDCIGTLRMILDRLSELEADLPAERQEKFLQRGLELLGTRGAAVDALGISGDDSITMKPSPSAMSDE